MNPKRHNQLSHKIAVLANLMTGALDEIGATSELATDFKNKCEELMPFCERIVDDTYQAKQIRSSTYLNELSNKVDTVIRKNYELIKE